jgi:hypothetical protein
VYAADDELARLDDVGSGILSAVPEELRQRIARTLQQTLRDDPWKTCCCCDVRSPSIALPGQDKLHHHLRANRVPLKAWTVLRPRPTAGIAPDLLSQYNLTINADVKEYLPADFFGQFAQVLLSPRGVDTSAGEAQLVFCTSCIDSLRSNCKGAPIYAIANNFCIGRLPEDLRLRPGDCTADANVSGISEAEWDLCRTVFLQPGRVKALYQNKQNKG